MSSPSTYSRGGHEQAAVGQCRHGSVKRTLSRNTNWITLGRLGAAVADPAMLPAEVMVLPGPPGQRQKALQWFGNSLIVGKSVTLSSQEMV